MWIKVQPRGRKLIEADVRFVPKADIALGLRHVRYTPKADIVERNRHVRFVPKDGVIGRRLVDS